MEIDLGNTTVYKIKMNGEEHIVNAPSVFQAKSFQEKMKASSGKEFEVFLEFVSELGLPKSSCEKLDVVQLKKLSDGLLSAPEKK